MDSEAKMRQSISPKKTRANILQSSPRKGTLGTSPTKSTHSVIKNVVASKQALRQSKEYENVQGLTEENIELDHLRTIVIEHGRENKVVESLQADIVILKEQLARADEKYNSLENVRTKLEKDRVEQARSME